jgi:hypothetical protein
MSLHQCRFLHTSTTRSEHPPSLDITSNAPQAIPDFNADPDHTTERDVDATSGKIDRGSATPPPTAASAGHHTPARDLLPLVNYNTRTTMYSGDTTDTGSLPQLHLAVTDDCELQITFTTVEDHAAALAWTLQHGLINNDDRYYMQVSSPLLQDLLEPPGTTTPHPLAIGPAQQLRPASF